MQSLPLLLSIPHGSTEVPPEVRTRMLATGECETSLKRRLLQESDPFTEAIYAIQAAIVLKAPVSRFVVDLNRRRDEDGENGIIKMTDFSRRAFYPEGFKLTEEERESRLSRYFDPYHSAMAEILSRTEIKFFLDCHSMSGQGPAIGPDSGNPRPAFCVANIGDETGKLHPDHHHNSCSPEMARFVKERLESIFQDLLSDAKGPRGVSLNHPFYEGFIVEHHSDPRIPHAKPGLMLEINRDLYLDESSLEPLPGRISRLNEGLSRLLKEISGFSPG